MKKAVIFDLDGTLWDPCKEIAISWNLATKDINIEEITLERIEGLMGKNQEEIAKDLFSSFSIEEGLEILRKCFDYEEEYIKKHGATLYENLENTLIELKKNYELYIVSNCQSGYIEIFLDFYNFHNYFVDIECAGNTNLPKGENIKLIIERNNIEKSIYVGDTMGDYTAAKFATVPFVYAKYGLGKVEDNVKGIEKIEDIINVAKEILE